MDLANGHWTLVTTWSWAGTSSRATICALSTETALLTSISGQHTCNWTSYLLPPVRGTRAVGNGPQGNLIGSSAISSGSPLLSRPRRRFPATDDAPPLARVVATSPRRACHPRGGPSAGART